MDPNETFEQLCIAWEYGKYNQARQHAEDLSNWLERGGFYPLGYPKEYVHTLINHALKERRTA